MTWLHWWSGRGCPRCGCLCRGWSGCGRYASERLQPEHKRLAGHHPAADVLVVERGDADERPPLELLGIDDLVGDPSGVGGRGGHHDNKSRTSLDFLRDRLWERLSSYHVVVEPAPQSRVRQVLCQTYDVLSVVPAITNDDSRSNRSLRQAGHPIHDSSSERGVAVGRVAEGPASSRRWRSLPGGQSPTKAQLPVVVLAYATCRVRPPAGPPWRPRPVRAWACRAHTYDPSTPPRVPRSGAGRSPRSCPGRAWP
jgi:hypothetical protein